MTEMKVWVTPTFKEPEQRRLRTRNGQLKEAIENNLMTNYRNEAYGHCTFSSHLLDACVYMYILAIIFSLLPIFLFTQIIGG